jgi:hypothetical protein
MSGCFDLWSTNVKEIKRFRLILKRAAKKMMMRAVAMTFSTWAATVEETKRYRGLLKRAAKKMTMRAVAMTFSTWASAVEETKRYRGLLKRAAKKMQNRTLNACFNTWCDAIEEKKRYAIIMKRVAAKIQQRTITLALNRWVEMVQERQDMRNIVKRALSKIARQVESAGFRKWTQVWRFQRRMDNSDAKDELVARRDKAIRRIVIRTQGSLYAKGWNTWVHVALTMRKYEMIIRKCAARMKYRTATLCLTGWREYVNKQAKHRRVVEAALFRLKHRTIISAYSSWKTTTARIVRNRRVLVIHLDRRSKLFLEQHVKAWVGYFTIGRKTRTQLKRIWRLKRARYMRLYWYDWMAKVATKCTVCHRTSRPLYKKGPEKLVRTKDWTKRESGWDRKVHRTDIPDYLKVLPPLKSPPPNNLKKTLLPRQSPQDLVGSRSMGALKKIIDRAGKLVSFSPCFRPFGHQDYANTFVLLFFLFFCSWCRMR